MLETDPRRRLKIGLFTVAVFGMLAMSILMIGGKQGLFVRHVSYYTRFTDVRGLVAGAPVHLNGVVAGAVDEVELPSDPARREITVKFRVQSRLAQRIRDDSRVEIGTLGLLGDRYLEINSGNPERPPLPPGSEVRSDEGKGVAEALSKSGDVMTNVLAISGSLRRVLERVERGEGILGELTMSPEAGPQVMQRLDSVLEQADVLLRDVRAGRGVLGRLVSEEPRDVRIFEDLQAMVAAGREATESLARDLRRDDSLLAGLLRDPRGRERVERFVDSLGRAAAAAASAGEDLAQRRGTLGRLISDEKLADDFLGDLAGLTRALRAVADKLDRGEGSAGRLINDDALVEDLENVVRGVHESRLLRWLIRNRREAGEEAQSEAAPGGGSGGGGR